MADRPRDGENFSNQSSGWILKRQMASAGLAGMLADGTVFPMMTVKSRMQVQGGGGGSAVYSYTGPLQAIQTIAAKEGVKTLYKGFGTVAFTAPAQGLYMGAYQSFKKFFPGGDQNPLVHFGGGLVATLVQSTIMVPSEIVRQRQMVQITGAGSYTGSLHAITSIYRHEGLFALYRGFWLAQMVWGPYNALYFPLWEATKKLSVWCSGVDSIAQLDMRWELASSFCSAGFAAGVTNPMDIVKTRLQVQGKSNVSSSTQYNGALDAARSIWRQEGWKGFTKGATSRMLWIAPSSMIMFTTFDQLMKRFAT
eukprot:TRINITY_DN5795_c0_g2_i1.p1 TRINITY_DN5795_c0_g2~~TRINITY_DN5795_c0_g2_i1.p1  ORF type:complete len:309 (-),score=36.37 TRINITY_DN5795_c0_g2_i1:384-1310(-)